MEVTLTSRSAPVDAGRRRHARHVTLVAVAAVLAAAAIGGAWLYAHRLPTRFAAVVDGQLYRSGLVTPAQLERVQRECGVQRVISLLNPDAPESIAERAAAERLGIVWENIPLRGDGSSTPADRARLVELLTDANAPPTLVHCAAGVNRTGLAVGLYRIHVQGWTYEQVYDEMSQFGFEDREKHENLRAALQEAAAGRK